MDNRCNEGVPESLINTALPGIPVSAGRGVFEAPTVTCSHCQVVVVLNPLRNRERAYCIKCDHYICDGCGVILAQTKTCKTFKQLVEETQEAAVREQQKGIITI